MRRFNMITANQVAYWSLQENIRHNQAQEEEAKRANVAKEQLTASQLAEDRRSNIAKESLEGSKLIETTRSNKAQESLKSEAQSENIRHNIETEKQGMANTITQGVKNIGSVLTSLANPILGLFK